MIHNLLTIHLVALPETMEAPHESGSLGFHQGGGFLSLLVGSRAFKYALCARRFLKSAKLVYDHFPNFVEHLLD
jgi:hypothetical protein